MECRAGTHSVNFYFFTREEAARWERVAVPFRRQKLQLTHANRAQMAHDKETTVTDPWKRQAGRDGVKNSSMSFCYRVHLLKMTSFFDVGISSRYLRNGLTARKYQHT